MTMRTNPATFVLVHGAWGGGWVWRRVADRLRAASHRVFTPTLTGLGDRSHLCAPTVNLTTHVLDVVNLVLWEDLDRVVLCGHSYGGAVITGVAERLAARIGAIVYVDAFIPADGEAVADIAPRRPAAGETTPPPSGNLFRVNARDRAGVEVKSTPKPNGTFTERLAVTGAYRRIARRAFVRASLYDAPHFRGASVRAGRDCRVRKRQIGPRTGRPPSDPAQFGDLPRREGRQAEHDLPRPPDQRHRQAQLRRQAERHADRHIAALLHAERAGHQEAGRRHRTAEALDGERRRDADRMAHKSQRQPDFAATEAPCPEMQADRTNEAAGTAGGFHRRGDRRELVGRQGEDFARDGEQAALETGKASGLPDANRGGGQRADAGEPETDATRQIAGTSQRNQGGEPHRREQHLGRRFRQLVENDARARMPQPHPVQDQNAGAHHLAADLGDRQQQIRGLAHAARPQQQRGTAAVVGRQQAAPAAAVDRRDDDMQREDCAEADADRGEVAPQRMHVDRKDERSSQHTAQDDEGELASPSDQLPFGLSGAHGAPRVYSRRPLHSTDPSYDRFHLSRL